MNKYADLVRSHNNKIVYLIRFIMFLLIVFSIKAFAQNQITQVLAVPDYEVAGDRIDMSDFPVGLITDEQGLLSIDDIAVRHKPDAIISSRFNIPSDTAFYWFIFKLTNTSQKPVQRIVRFDEPYLESAEIYYRDGKEWHSEKNGLLIPIAERTIQNRVPVFLITVQPNETKTIYLRFHSKYKLTLGTAVEDIKEFADYEQWQLFIYAALFGAAGAILLYNLFLFFFLRDRAYIYYVLYGSCFLIFVSLYSGHFHYLFSSVSLYYDFCFFTALMVAFIGAFTRRVLDTRRNMPKLDKALLAFIILYAVIAFLIVIDIYFYQWLVILGMPSTLIFLIAGIYGVSKRIPVAKYYLLAISAYLLGLFMIAALNVGVVPYNIFTRYGFLLGSLIELVVFSLALGFQFKLLQEEKLHYQNKLLNAEQHTRKKLETFVQQRTAMLEDANRELKRIAVLDGLTGLYNRRYFDDTLQREWKRQYRSGLPISLLMCDIDNFKQYNDTLGHQAGDDCIRTVAKIIDCTVGRASDTAARYGGEEFAVILPSTQTQGAYKIAEALKEALALQALSHPKSEGALVTMSFGVATLIPSCPAAAAELVAKADQALYLSKRAGRNRITVAK